MNFDKSKLVSVGNVGKIRQLAHLLGCKVSSHPLKNLLGLSLGFAPRAQVIWDPVIEKIEGKLAGWKRLYLSKGGRINLIKSTLSNLLTYLFSLFSLLASITSHIEKLFFVLPLDWYRRQAQISLS